MNMFELIKWPYELFSFHGSIRRFDGRRPNFGIRPQAQSILSVLGPNYFFRPKAQCYFHSTDYDPIGFAITGLRPNFYLSKDKYTTIPR